jgi:signal peptidase I
MSKKYVDPYADKKLAAKVWYFIWHDNSIWSWIVNIILAYIIIRFIVYPGLGAVFGTRIPIVAVVSGSMEHDGSFDSWWQSQRQWYTDNSITRAGFEGYPFRNGFNKGDLMVLRGEKPQNLKIGDVIVFMSQAQSDPIIHRVVKVWQTSDGEYHFQTKGDHNSRSEPGIYETDITTDKVLGKAIFRVPVLGWVKIGFVEGLRLIGLMR